MTLPSTRRLALFAALLGFSSAGWAQTVVSYIDPNGNAEILSPGGSISFPSTSVGASAPLTFDIANRGADPITINSVNISGAPFQLSGAPLPGSSLTAGSDVRFTVQFNPTQVGSASGTLTIAAGGFNGNISLLGTGAGASIVVTYFDSNGNAVVLNPGSSVAFPSTSVGATAPLTFNIANRGNQPATVNSVSISGAGFQLSGAPVPASAIPASSSVSFTVQFSPTQVGAAAGSLSINAGQFAGSISLSGTGAGAVYTYQVQSSSTVTQVVPGQTITFPDTALGATAAVTVTIKNTGNAPGTISTITVAGNGFALANGPFPGATLAAGASQTIGVTFSPTQPGAATGRLTIGNDAFGLASNGLGPALTFTYSVAGSTVALPANGTVSFSPIAAGATESTTITLVNSGTAQALVSNISAGGTSGAFNVAGLPALPLQLNPGASSSFQVVFAPNTTGTLTGTLQVDTSSFSLLGSATAPPALSNAVFSGPSGTEQPLSQPAIGLSLQSPYPLPLNGTLTLQFASAVFSDDPSIQFSTGGRTVAFTIPANTTAAIFPGNTSQISLQTGSVAGTISLAASFATASGLALQPANTPALNLTIPQTAPQITGLAFDSASSTGFNLDITGLATSRQISQITVQFTPLSNLGVSIPNATINASATFNTWYLSTASDAYGSMFTATIPFTLSGQVSGYADLFNALQSVTVTISNSQGSSSPQTLSLR